MNQEIYIVYVTYFSTVEQMYAFTSKTDADIKRLILLQEWVDNDEFTEYIRENNIHNITIDTYDDYFLAVEDDSYVGINTVVLNN